jgi:hypothetical protein
MAHFAKINSDNIVEQVIVISNNFEERGQEYINNDLKLEGTWLQTSYNTRANQHASNKTPLRKNFALIGSFYDAQRDAFIPPKQFASWILNEETCNWNAPVSYPNDGKRHKWNELIVNWEEVTPPQQN